jgi:hypothetical protein
MGSKIDEKTLVPIGWVLTGLAAIFFIVLRGAFWMSSVDGRLQRIEDKLGVPPYQASSAIIHEARASQ